jgi:hypothetical protein
MNYRLQLSPIFGNSRSQTDVPFRERPQYSIVNSEEGKIFRSWLVYDSSLEDGRSNWNTFTGITFALAVSVACWIGLGYAVARVLK